MKKILLSLLLILPIINADYIPYEKLKSMEYTLKAGYRSGLHADSVILSEEDGYPTVQISKRLYFELLKHDDYKNKFHKIEWSNLTDGTKSYEYTLKIPKESFMNIPFEKGLIYEIKHAGRYKECIGYATIMKDDGYIYCEADTLESMFKK